MKILFPICFFILLTTTSIGKSKSVSVNVIYDKNIPELQFAIDEFRKAGPDMIVVNFEMDKSLGKEEFQITRKGNTILAKGGDANGLMYAGLELAENIQDGKDLRQITNLNEKPYMPYRGIKFNFPLDARTQMLDWDALIPFVKEDVNIAIRAKKGEPVDVDGTNKLWKRDMTKQLYLVKNEKIIISYPLH